MPSQIELILSDCMPGLHNTPDKFYDLAIVDPPYGGGQCCRWRSLLKI